MRRKPSVVTARPSKRIVLRSVEAKRHDQCCRRKRLDGLPRDTECLHITIVLGAKRQWNIQIGPKARARTTLVRISPNRRLPEYGWLPECPLGQAGLFQRGTGEQVSPCAASSRHVVFVGALALRRPPPQLLVPTRATLFAITTGARLEGEFLQFARGANLVAPELKIAGVFIFYQRGSLDARLRKLLK